jgi:arginine exporter protein ArgO
MAVINPPERKLAKRISVHCVSKYMPHVYTESASFIGSFGGKIVETGNAMFCICLFACLFDFCTE